MAIRKYKPTTPGRRGSSVADFVEITRTTPEKSLTRPLPKKGGRNNQGRITTRHQGGGHKRAYRDHRLPSLRQGRRAGQGRAHRVRPQPHRPDRAAALRRRREALHRRAEGPEPGHDAVESGPTPTSRPATTCRCATSRSVRRSTASSCGPVAARRSPARPATARQLVAKEGSRATLRMPSGEMRFVDVRCRATIGEVGNAEQSNINWGKAGRMRWKGKRPTVRGVVMNPVDHPHGGGEGKTSGGRHPVAPWGKPEGRTAQGQGQRQADHPSPPYRQEALSREIRDNASQPEEGPLRRRPPDEEGGRRERQGHPQRHQDLVAPLDDRARP